MYVLMYEESNYDEHHAEVLAVSYDKAALERKVAEYHAEHEVAEAARNRYREATREHYEGEKAKVAAFIDRNTHALINPHAPQFMTEWKVADPNPWPKVMSEDQRRMVRAEAINHWHYFWDGGQKAASRWMDFSAVSEPLPHRPQPPNIKDFDIPPVSYHMEHLHIHEVPLV